MSWARCSLIPASRGLVLTGLKLRHGPGALHVGLGKVRPILALHVLSEVLRSDLSDMGQAQLVDPINPSPFRSDHPPTALATATRPTKARTPLA